METNNYLTDITAYLNNDTRLVSLAKKIAIHPGKMGKSAIETIQSESECENEICSHIYLWANEVSETEFIETEQEDITLQGIAYVLALNNSLKTRKECFRTFYTLIEYLLGILNNQRWNLNYTFPVSDINAMDLYGLSYDSDKLAASEGWDPTLQAYAKDLYQKDGEGPYPQNLTLWYVTWKQKLRIGKNVFLESGVL